MDAATGTDTLAPSSDVDRLLAGIRRLTALADGAATSEAIFRALASELMTVPGAEEVHIHHLAAPGEDEDLVAVYMFETDGRLSYLTPRAERPPGVSWVARTGRSFLAAGSEELAASVPRLAATGAMSCALLLPLAEHAEVGAVVVLVRRFSEQFPPNAVELGSTLVDQGATGLALVRARAEAGTDPVSGSMNHRAMRRRLDEEIGRAMRTGGPLSCMLIDLDNFKLVNDRYGHQAGDAMLRAVVDALVGRVPRVRPCRTLRRRRVRRDPAERRARERRRGGVSRPRAAQHALLPRGDRLGGICLDWRGPVAGSDEHRRAARGM